MAATRNVALAMEAVAAIGASLACDALAQEWLRRMRMLQKRGR